MMTALTLAGGYPYFINLYSIIHKFAHFVYTYMHVMNLPCWRREVILIYVSMVAQTL